MYLQFRALSCTVGGHLLVCCRQSLQPSRSLPSPILPQPRPRHPLALCLWVSCSGSNINGTSRCGLCVGLLPLGFLFSRPVYAAACTKPPSFLGLSDTPGCVQTTYCPSICPSAHGYLSCFWLLAAVGVVVVTGVEMRGPWGPCFQFICSPRLGARVLAHVKAVIPQFLQWLPLRSHSWRRHTGLQRLRIRVHIRHLAVVAAEKQRLVLV